MEEPESDFCWLRVSKEMTLQFYNHNKANYANNLNELEVNISPRPPDQRPKQLSP